MSVTGSAVVHLLGGGSLAFTVCELIALIFVSSQYVNLICLFHCGDTLNK